MNDLVELKDVWGQPGQPSPTAHSAARAALMQQIDAGVPASAPRRVRRGRGAWWIGGTAVTATLAAAVAFAVAVGPARPQPSSDHLSGQQILLAAATVAESRPAGAGAYWHLKEMVPDLNGRMQALDQYTTHDGALYTMPEGYAGVMLMSKGGGFDVGGSALSFGQLQQLPTDPVALKAWITDSYVHPSAPKAIPGVPALPVGKTDIPAVDMPGQMASALSELLWEVPAPPAVRAAALRALASMPNVTNLGAKDGGQALRISFPVPPADKYPNGKVPAGAGEWTLVIDPATSMLISTTDYTGTVKILAAEWTNHLPNIITPNK